MISRLSEQQTQRLKHKQDADLQLELLRSAMEAYPRAAANGQEQGLVDLTLALRGLLAGPGAEDPPGPAGTPPGPVP